MPVFFTVDFAVLPQILSATQMDNKYLLVYLMN